MAKVRLELIYVAHVTYPYTSSGLHIHKMTPNYKGHKSSTPI